MAKHGNTEKHLINLFKQNGSFNFKGETHKVIIVDNPTISKGECKTDVYVKTEDSAGQFHEFKLSVKQDDADFLENKIKLDRAKEILGENAHDILVNSIRSIKDEFERDVLITFARYKKTEEKCIKIGWKFEFTNKKSGDKSGLLELTDQQRLDVYAGVNLSKEKRNALVNNRIIENSGVANFILEIDANNLSNDLDFYINGLIDIESYSKTKPIYFACKAINYRYTKDKWDNDRPLAVYCDWKINDRGELECKLNFDSPLQKTANPIGANIRNLLTRLNIFEEGFESLKTKVDSTIKIHES